ncbi:hypothetical protein HPB52_005047 [Rhipicephalus sanguineus]|uniref:Uncharacterized protein n=1 Tax=Rhipicephalus sanguineus TaxID=34632 RepID=A0A9D4T2U3_RHISA|nr:hypothetical protein HPB52_005047 [Rhipicephalus sanguineus]
MSVDDLPSSGNSPTANEVGVSPRGEDVFQDFPSDKALENFANEYESVSRAMGVVDAGVSASARSLPVLTSLYCDCGLRRSGLLAMVHRVANRSGEQRKEAALSEKVACLRKNVGSIPSSKSRFVKTLRVLEEHDLVVVQDDKEGGISVLPEATFHDKARCAIGKNFKQVTIDP